MVAVGIAWLARPRMLLLDEPTAGLAPSIAESLLESITGLINESALNVILVEQNARRALKWSKTAIILREGQKVYHGDSEECLNDKNILDTFLGVG